MVQASWLMAQVSWLMAKKNVRGPSQTRTRAPTPFFMDHVAWPDPRALSHETLTVDSRLIHKSVIQI